ncbi:MAG: EFR1 family ferrodoxin [Desulfohalobiaceae bacterium]|nr:EFR1 family ferrodoxin [Desulfohalobiaceae bacterium]
MNTTPTHCLAYCSPAGSTAGLAETIGHELSQQDLVPVSLNLGDPDWKIRARSVFSQEAPVFLWLGSPVYAHHPVPLVASFLDWLPPQKQQPLAVPFVTWGEVCSGTALLDMGRALEDKGFQLAGAAALPAEHSSTWMLDQPFGAGRPDARDHEELRTLVRQILNSLASGTLTGIAAHDLDYQPETVKAFARSIDIHRVKQHHPGYALDQERCTQCGTCRDQCPAGAISLDPYPVISQACFLCNNCVRFCPEEAMSVTSGDIRQRLLDMQQQFGEKPQPRIFPHPA